MMTVQQAFDLALQHHQAGRLAEAEALYRQVLAVQAGHIDAAHLLGVVALQTGRPEAAAELFVRVRAVVPNHPAVHSNLGEAYRLLGRMDDAMASFHRALELKPEDALARFNLGNVLLDLGRVGEAIATYQRALELKPDYADAHNNLGIAFGRQGMIAEAAEAYRRALQLAPGHAGAWNNLGIVLAMQGLFSEAVEAYRRALELFPNQPEAHNNLGNACKELGQFEQAISCYREALKMRPDCTEFHANLGNVLREQGRLGEAIESYRRALDLQPRRAETHNELGNALRERGQLDEAVAEYRTALRLNPEYADAESNLGNALRDQGQTDEAITAYRCAIQFAPADFRPYSNLIYTLHFHPEYDDEAIAKEQRVWNERFAEPWEPSVRTYTNDRTWDRRLRIGYVSPDFRDHVIGRNVLPLLKGHDREAFEILCYSGVARSDGITRQFREKADQWRSTLGVNDEALAEIIRCDGVDILVDLTQHMAGNRLTMFARRPAPVQVSFAGYPEGAGLEAIAYRISDRFLEPVPRDGLFLIDSFWCYDPCGMEVEVNASPAPGNGWVTFGCLNNFCKVTEATLRLWAQVLVKVRDSRLMILSPSGSHRQRTLQSMEREGVDPKRIEFVEPRGRHAYLQLYRRFDVMLDTFPYNGHTTSLDALWMGVPVVSLAGERAVSRAGLSQLTNLGLPELIARSEGEYVAIANGLAGDLSQLAELRRTLRTRMEGSVLMDGLRFAKGIEAAYRQMWRQWCQG